MKLGHKKVFALILVIVIVLISVLGSLYYIKQKNENAPHKIIVIVIINYDGLKQPNEERHNKTLMSGSTALEAFASVAELELVNYSFGVYIKGVNGYEEQLPACYWAFYYYDHQKGEWIYSEVGVSNYYLKNNDWIKLQYTHTG